MTDYMNEEKIYTQADLNEAVTKAISDMSKVLEEKERLIAGLRMTYQASTLEKVKNTIKCDCENCDFRKFTETFVDGVVAVMNKNGITSLEQLSEILKGVAE